MCVDKKKKAFGIKTILAGICVKQTDQLKQEFKITVLFVENRHF